MTTTPVGNRIRAERQRRGWTQEQLARLAGVNIGTVARSEAVRPSLQTAAKLATALGCGIEDLITCERATESLRVGKLL